MSTEKLAEEVLQGTINDASARVVSHVQEAITAIKAAKSDAEAADVLSMMMLGNTSAALLAMQVAVRDRGMNSYSDFNELLMKSLLGARVLHEMVLDAYAKKDDKKVH
jgi:hypothetical protein